MKGSYICILLVFMTSSVSAQPATCTSCWNIGQTECCSTNTVTCPNGQCMTVSQKCTLGDLNLATIQKTCANTEICSGCFSVSTGLGMDLRLSAQCATGDFSNDNLNYEVDCSSLDTENGYECDACYDGTTTDGCTATTKIKCRGAETECLTYRGIIQVDDSSIRSMSLKGCVTAGGCDLGIRVLPGDKELKPVEMTCVAADLVSE